MTSVASSPSMSGMEIHDHDVGPSALGQRDRGRAVGRLADHADARARECEAEPFANDLVVVRDQQVISSATLGFYEALRAVPASSLRKSGIRSREILKRVRFAAAALVVLQGDALDDERVAPAPAARRACGEVRDRTLSLSSQAP